ncbi:MAG TPA: hypothetical protein PKI19_10170 [Elusimicrobiales bacterium]|nr:hypothetical protein [Elusimicrobiales bacterium]
MFLGVAGLLINEILKYRCALDMAANPQRLLWAHPTAWTKDPNDRNSEATFATFHSESGRSLEVWMRSETRTALFAWFKQQNPAVRLTGSPPR